MRTLTVIVRVKSIDNDQEYIKIKKYDFNDSVELSVYTADRDAISFDVDVHLLKELINKL